MDETKRWSPGKRMVAMVEWRRQGYALSTKDIMRLYGVSIATAKRDQALLRHLFPKGAMNG
jgi:predicted DNA-binding transcriptional regulator YafY